MWLHLCRCLYLRIAPLLLLAVVFPTIRNNEAAAFLKAMPAKQSRAHRGAVSRPVDPNSERAQTAAADKPDHMKTGGQTISKQAASNDRKSARTKSSTKVCSYMISAVCDIMRIFRRVNHTAERIAGSRQQAAGGL